MRPLASTLAASLLLSVALPAGFAIAADPGEQLMLERANYWRAQHRFDLVRDILGKILAANPMQPDALYQQGLLAMEQGDRFSAQHYFDRLRLLALDDGRTAQRVSPEADPAATPASTARTTSIAMPASVASAPVVAAAVPVSGSVGAAPVSPKTADKPVAAASPQPAPRHEASLFAVATADSDDLIAAPRSPAPAPRREAPVFATASADSDDLIATPRRTAPAPQHEAPVFAATSAESDDLVATPRSTGPEPARDPALPPTPHGGPTAVQLAVLPRSTVSDTDAPLSVTATGLVSAGSDDVGITATKVQVAQVELQPPPPVSASLPLSTLRPYSPSDTLQTYIDRDLAFLEAQANPTLVAGLTYRSHNGTEGLQGLSEIGGIAQLTFSPWYTGMATFSVLPAYLYAGTPANINLTNFGANQLQVAAGLSRSPAGQQDAAGVGLLGSYSWGDFSGQFGTTPLGFRVTNFVGDVAYVPKFLSGTLSLRIEGLRQPITDTVLSYAGTRANFAVANMVAPGAFGKNTVWGGVVKTGPRLSVFYDDQTFGAYGAAGVSSVTGTNVKDNSEVDALLGAYIRPWKPSFGQLRVGVSLFYESFDKNLNGYTFGQGGYFSPQDFEGLGFPIEFAGVSGAWSYLASTSLGVQHFNANSSPIFPNNPSAQAALETLTGGSARTTATHSGFGFGFNFKGQVEYAVDKTFSLGLAGSVNNGNDYNEGIVQLYLRKTFDWLGGPAAARDDPQSIAARDQPMSRL